MGRRRGTPSNSSLDLFLDTICNAFGGIMFLSILISLLVQLKGKESSSTADRRSASAEKLDEMRQRTESLARKKQQLSSAIAILESSLAGPESDEILSLQERASLINQNNENEAKNQLQLTEKISSLIDEINTKKQELEDLDLALMNARTTAREKSSAMDDALDANEPKTEIPSVRSTSKGNVLFAMRFGKVYLVSDPDSLTDELNSKHVNVTKTLGITRVQLKSNAGWDLSEAQGRSQFEGTISNIEPASKFLSIAVWPDSYQEFSDLKAKLIQKGYDYQLVPVDNVEELVIGASSNAAVQ